MKGFVLAPLYLLRVIYQSAHLALSQIWANKTRSILTTMGIVIGVASVTAVIAALTGLKAKVLSQVESFGSNSIIIQASRPDKGPGSQMSWRDFRFSEEELEGLDFVEHGGNAYPDFEVTSYGGMSTAGLPGGSLAAASAGYVKASKKIEAT